MKKTFTILLVSAVAVWGYVAVQVVVVLLGKSSDTANQTGTGPVAAFALLTRSSQPLDTAFRDPFQSYLYAQKPAPVVVLVPGHHPSKAIVAIEPPKAVLSGVLWGDEPVAILKQDGQTELVKKGAEIWGLKVLRIDKNQVVVVKQGRQFTLEY